MSAGKHDFEFCTGLPFGAVPSFRSHNARVSYKVIVCIERKLLGTRKIPFEFFVVSAITSPFFRENVSNVYL